MNWNLIISLALLFGVIGLLPVMVVFGVRLMRRRVSVLAEDEDPYLHAVAMQTWETGKAHVGTVDGSGKLTIREVESSNDLKG